MKMLFVSALYHPNIVGGAEKVVRILAEGMRDAGHESVVATTDQQPGVRVADVNGVKVYYIGLKNIYWPHERKPRPAAIKPLWHIIDRHNPWMTRALARVIDQEQPDLVNTHCLTGFSPAVWPAVQRRQIPLVHTLHDYSLLCPKTSMFRNGANCATPCTACELSAVPGRRHSGCVETVVGVSRHTLERHLAQGFFRHATTRVIHNGLSGMPLPAVPARVADQPLRVGYVGQLTPTKGIAELVAVMRSWPASTCTLTVAGRGAADFELALRAQAPANVSFLGFVDPAQVYRRIDVLVVPSLWQEPLATVVLEAFMHGVPVIATNRGGMPEMVEHGRTGIVYEPSDPTGLRDAIAAFVSDRSLGSRMQPRLAERARYFASDRMRSDYLDVFEGVRRATV